MREAIYQDFRRAQRASSLTLGLLPVGRRLVGEIRRPEVLGIDLWWHALTD